MTWQRWNGGWIHVMEIPPWLKAWMAENPGKDWTTAHPDNPEAPAPEAPKAPKARKARTRKA